MIRLSLRGRMALLFVIVVTAVLTLAAVSFDYFSRLHFERTDTRMLEAKVSALRAIITRGDDFDLGMASDIQRLADNSFGFAAAIMAGDRIMYSHHNLSEDLATLLSSSQDDRWVVEVGRNRYSGITERIEGWAGGEGGTIQLAMDITHRAHFFDMIRRWFIYTLVASAILSGALGFVFIRHGLMPISRLSKTSSMITAHCLDTRISTASVPAELHELVGNFNDMLERLDQSFLRLSNFSADIAHELRNPLNSMLTQTEVALMQDRKNADYKDVLYSTLEELRRMSRMVDDMLFLAKADIGMITPDFDDQDLAEIASSVLEYYEYAADEKGIKLIMHHQGAMRVRGDNLMLRRAVSNIMSNAVRYGDVGTTINVRLSQVGQWVRLEISNHGPTIPPKHIGKLFDRFYRIDTARREGNTLNIGLGMAITRSIVESHSGAIHCQSADGVTTFGMKLPVAI